MNSLGDTFVEAVVTLESWLVVEVRISCVEFPFPLIKTAVTTGVSFEAFRMIFWTGTIPARKIKTYQYRCLYNDASAMLLSRRRRSVVVKLKRVTLSAHCTETLCR